MKSWNFVRKAFVMDPNLFLAIALIASVVDIMRVMPLTLADTSLMQNTPGIHLYLGLADTLLLAFLYAATPRVAVLIAMLGGVILGVAVQILGLPALSGWISISVPWLLCNRTRFALSRREKLYLVVAIAFVCSWGALVYTGHVTDPGMQGGDSIGWLYGVEPVNKIHSGLLVQFRKDSFLFVRRVQEVSGDVVVLGADNPDFGEDYKQLRVPESDITGQVSWLFYPARFTNPSGYEEWQRRTILVGSQATKMPAPSAAGMYHNTRLGVWVIVNYDWDVLQSGTGTPHVVGNLVTSIGGSQITAYDPSKQYGVVGQYDYNEAGVATMTAIIYSSDGEVGIINRSGNRIVGEIEGGESLNEAARRLGLPQAD